MLARLAVRGGPLGSDTWYVVGMLTLNFYLPLLITIMFSHDGTLTERHTRTATHTLAQTQDKLQGWVDGCGVRGNATHTHTHIWRNACCVVRWSAARKRGRRRETEKAQWHTEDVWQQGFLLTIMAEALWVLSLSWCLNSMTHLLCKWNNVFAPDVGSKWTSG